MADTITQDDFKTGVADDTGTIYSNVARKDPLRPFRFAITVVSSTQKEYFLGGVTKVTGLKWKVGTFKYFDGGAMIPKSVPTRPEYEPIVLTRAIFHSDEIWEWCKKVFFQNDQSGEQIFRLAEMRVYQLPYHKLPPTDVPLTQVGKTVMAPERGWKIINCYPSEYDMGELDRDADGVSLATITIEHEGVVVLDTIMNKWFVFDPDNNTWSIS